jgi:hypothetical protein
MRPPPCATRTTSTSLARAIGIYRQPAKRRKGKAFQRCLYLSLMLGIGERRQLDLEPLACYGLKGRNRFAGLKRMIVRLGVQAPSFAQHDGGPESIGACGLPAVGAVVGPPAVCAGGRDKKVKPRTVRELVGPLLRLGALYRFCAQCYGIAPSIPSHDTIIATGFGEIGQDKFEPSQTHFPYEKARLRGLSGISPD